MTAPPMDPTRRTILRGSALLLLMTGAGTLLKALPAPPLRFSALPETLPAQPFAYLFKWSAVDQAWAEIRDWSTLARGDRVAALPAKGNGIWVRGRIHSAQADGCILESSQLGVP